MSEPLNLLENEFRELLKRAFPGMGLEAFDPGQVREMRRMFMAGARALHRIIETYMSPDDAEPNPEEIAVTASIERELAEFIAAVSEGRA